MFKKSSLSKVHHQQEQAEDKIEKFSEQNKKDFEQDMMKSTFSLRRARPKIPQAIQLKMKKQNMQSMIYLGDKLNMKFKKLEGKTFKCQICEGEFDKKVKVSLSKCSHYFCNSCLQHYALYKIERFEEVVCPQEECDKPLDLKGQFFSGLPTQAKGKAKKIMAFYSTLKNQNLRLCPSKQCQNGIINMEGEQTTVSCNVCEQQFCSKCLFPAHEGNCQKNEVDFFQKNLRYRQCVKCKMIIERSEGCRRMKCHCGYQFCYVFGIKWPGYHHTHTPEEQFGVDGNLNQNVGNVEPPPPPPPFHLPDGVQCVIYFLSLIIRIPFFIVCWSIRTVLQVVIIITSLYSCFWIGICGMPCHLADECDCPCPVLFLFLPFFMIAGVLYSFYTYLSQKLCEQFGDYQETIVGIWRCLLYPS